MRAALAPEVELNLVYSTLQTRRLHVLLSLHNFSPLSLQLLMLPNFLDWPSVWLAQHVIYFEVRGDFYLWVGLEAYPPCRGLGGGRLV